MTNGDIKNYLHFSNWIEDVHDDREVEEQFAMFEAFKDKPVTLESILDMHKRVGHLNEYCKAGELRDYDVFVGNKKCLAPEQVEHSLVFRV